MSIFWLDVILEWKQAAKVMCHCDCYTTMTPFVSELFKSYKCHTSEGSQSYSKPPPVGISRRPQSPAQVLITLLNYSHCLEAQLSVEVWITAPHMFFIMYWCSHGHLQPSCSCQDWLQVTELTQCLTIIESNCGLRKNPHRYFNVSAFSFCIIDWV